MPALSAAGTKAQKLAPSAKKCDRVGLGKSNQIYLTRVRYGKYFFSDPFFSI